MSMQVPSHQIKTFGRDPEVTKAVKAGLKELEKTKARDTLGVQYNGRTWTVNSKDPDKITKTHFYDVFVHVVKMIFSRSYRENYHFVINRLNEAVSNFFTLTTAEKISGISSEISPVKPDEKTPGKRIENLEKEILDLGKNIKKAEDKINELTGELSDLEKFKTAYELKKVFTEAEIEAFANVEKQKREKQAKANSEKNLEKSREIEEDILLMDKEGLAPGKERLKELPENLRGTFEKLKEKLQAAGGNAKNPEALKEAKNGWMIDDINSQFSTNELEILAQLESKEEELTDEEKQKLAEGENKIQKLSEELRDNSFQDILDSFKALTKTPPSIIKGIQENIKELKDEHNSLLQASAQKLEEKKSLEKELIKQEFLLFKEHISIGDFDQFTELAFISSKSGEFPGTAGNRMAHALECLKGISGLQLNENPDVNQVFIKDLFNPLVSPSEFARLWIKTELLTGSSVEKSQWLVKQDEWMALQKEVNKLDQDKINILSEWTVKLLDLMDIFGNLTKEEVNQWSKLEKELNLLEAKSAREVENPEDKTKLKNLRDQIKDFKKYIPKSDKKLSAVSIKSSAENLEEFKAIMMQGPLFVEENTKMTLTKDQKEIMEIINKFEKLYGELVELSLERYGKKNPPSTNK